MANQSNPTPAAQAAAAQAAKDAAEKAAQDAAKKAEAEKAQQAGAAAKPGKAVALSSNGKVHVVTDGIETWKHEGELKDAVAPRLAGRSSGAKSADGASEEPSKGPKRGKIVALSSSKDGKVHTVTDGVETWKHEGELKDAVAPSRAAQGGDA